MQQFYIESVKPGMTLGKTIYDDRNNELLKSGTVLSENIIKRLKDKGFYTLCIDTLESKGIVLDDNIPITVRHQAVTAIKNLDIPSVIDSAKEIVSCICDTLNISFDLLDNRNGDNFDYEHAIAVTEMAIAVGSELRDKNGELMFNRSQLEELAVASLLHDIGKRCSDRRVLEKLNASNSAKDTVLSYSEKLSPVYGYCLLKDNVQVPSVVKASVLFHRTDENGKNMPIAIDKSRIHIFARIIHVADFYDILIHHKTDSGVYLSTSEAIEYLMASCGTKFNLDVVQAFIRHVPIYPKGTKVTLSNGLEGVVYENKVGEMLRPKILLKDGTIIDLMNNNSITIVPDQKQVGGKSLC